LKQQLADEPQTDKNSLQSVELPETVLKTDCLNCSIDALDVEQMQMYNKNIKDHAIASRTNLT